MADQDADEVLVALDELMAALDANLEAAKQIRARAAAIREARVAGWPYGEIVRAEERPLIVELVTEKLDRLSTAGSRLRRAEAAALHREGLSMDRIAEVFGVTRQRVSALLRTQR